MAKVRNYHVYGEVNFINRLKEDYDFLGRNAKIVEPGHLVVFALPPRKEKVKSDERSRNKDRRGSGLRKEVS